MLFVIIVDKNWRFSQQWRVNIKRKLRVHKSQAAVKVSQLAQPLSCLGYNRVELSKVIFRKDPATGKNVITKDAKVACKLLAINY